jgi:hypothetical protein
VPGAGYTKRKARWSQEEVLGAIGAWTELYGSPPTATDWHPGDAMAAARRSADRARAWAVVAERFHEGEWPWTGTVQRLFGGWNAALRAAGVPVRWDRRRRVELDVASGSLDTDELKAMVEEVERAMVEGNEAHMQMVLCRIAERASAWAAGVEM